MTLNIDKDQFDFNDLVALMERLRDPDNGCPWDLDQDFSTMKQYTIEEAYEVADAIERNDMEDLKDELGDLLLQSIFHAKIAKDDNHFDINDVIDHIVKKMIFRHPHVFGDNAATDADDVKDRIWEQQKAKEKFIKTDKDKPSSVLSTVTMALPSLLLANKLQKKAIKSGFRYETIDGVFDKMHEELNELQQAIQNNDNKNIREELGDVLFCSALLSSYQGENPEELLRESCLKFKDRFEKMETILNQKDSGATISDFNIHLLLEAWCNAKAHTQKL